MTCGAVVVAAGRSERMGFNKTMALLAGRPVLLRVLDVLDQANELSCIVVATSPENVDRLSHVLRAEPYCRPVHLCAGGETRPESVRNGVRALPGEVDLVLIHDAARPLVTTNLIEACIRAGTRHGAAIAAVPVTDTIKQADDLGRIERTVDRSRLYAAQTPQVFRRDWLEDAYRRVEDVSGLRAFTDESSLVEWAGYTVHVCPGLVENIKLTTPFDLTLAESFLAQRERAPT